MLKYYMDVNTRAVCVCVCAFICLHCQSGIKLERWIRIYVSTYAYGTDNCIFSVKNDVILNMNCTWTYVTTNMPITFFHFYRKFTTFLGFVSLVFFSLIFMVVWHLLCSFRWDFHWNKFRVVMFRNVSIKMMCFEMTFSLTSTSTSTLIVSHLLALTYTLFSMECAFKWTGESRKCMHCDWLHRDQIEIALI